MAKKYAGEIKARVVEIRFALSGKIANVSKCTGDIVKKWDLVASLDRKILQTELDQQLADHEKVRADWDGFTTKYPNPQDDIKYTKAEKQASLNASVKQVELSKAKLDQTNLFSPVEGVILDDSNIVAGLYVTPANSSIKIIDTSSYYFEFVIDQADIPSFSKDRKCKIEIKGTMEDVKGETGRIFSDGKKFSVRIPISNNEKYLIGMKGVAKF